MSLHQDSSLTDHEKRNREYDARVHLSFRIERRQLSRYWIVYDRPDGSQFDRPATLEEMLLWDELERLQKRVRKHGLARPDLPC